MAQQDLDVIIPVKDRLTVLQCVLHLLAEAEQAEQFKLRKILLCDGGSQTVACQTQLHQVSQFPQVQILACPHPGFNKSWLQNQGIAAATAALVLMSDVDILWNAATLSHLSHAAANQPDCFYAVQSVQESELTPVADQRPRYTYRIHSTSSGHCVEIDWASPTDDARPGCGLLCAQRSLFQKVGGYRHCFQGWGWEDQDLLIRASLLGYRVRELGTVVHLSHSDQQRNAEYGQYSPQQTRDRNIMNCLTALTQHQLRGDLPIANTHDLEEERPSLSSITVRYPATLAHAADPNYPLPQSPQAPD